MDGAGAAMFRPHRVVVVPVRGGVGCVPFPREVHGVLDELACAGDQGPE